MIKKRLVKRWKMVTGKSQPELTRAKPDQLVPRMLMQLGLHAKASKPIVEMAVGWQMAKRYPVENAKNWFHLDRAAGGPLDYCRPLELNLYIYIYMYIYIYV